MLALFCIIKEPFAAFFFVPSNWSMVSNVALFFVSDNVSKRAAPVKERPPIREKGIATWTTPNHFASHGAKADPTRLVICKNPMPSPLKKMTIKIQLMLTLLAPIILTKEKEFWLDTAKFNYVRTPEGFELAIPDILR